MLTACSRVRDVTLSVRFVSAPGMRPAKDGFFCNQAGVCQVRSGCARNSECGADAFCDLVSGECVQDRPGQLGSRCSLPTHCPYLTVCKEGTCQDACVDDGDCPLGDVCIGELCFTGEGICRDESFCPLGMTCQSQRCAEDTRGPIVEDVPAGPKPPF